MHTFELYLNNQIIMYAITNESNTLYLSNNGGKFYWTSNREMAYTFKTEREAAIYEEESASDFLNFDTDILSYINEI